MSEISRLSSVPPGEQRRLYGDLAWTWPLMSPPGEYTDEAAVFRDALRQYASTEPRTLLDLGCGGGHNDYHLKRDFVVTGVDLSEAMLANARAVNPELTYLQGDLRTIRLEQTWDAVLIADAISYMLSEADLRAAFATAFVHLKPGGVFCTYVEVTKERFAQNKSQCWTAAQGELAITFLENSYDPDPADTTYDDTFVYLIREGGQLRIESDRHLNGIFELATWHTLLHDVGFEVVQTEFRVKDEEPIPMFVCRKPV